MKPVGKWSAEFKTEAGIICRAFAPVTCHDWRVVTPLQKHILYERIMEQFDIDLHVPHVKIAVDRYFGQRFKDYRNKFHNYYKLWKDDEEARENPFEDMSQEDWNVICDRFNSEKFRAHSTKNAENRELVKTNHSAGSKAFVQYREEMRDVETQEELGRIELYRVTHQKLDRSWISDTAKGYYEAMIEYKSQLVADGSDPMTEDEICDKVLGTRHGYIRGLGHGVVPPYLSSRYSQSEVSELIRRAEEAERRAEEQNRKIEEMQQENDRNMKEMQSRQTALENQLQLVMSRFSGGN